MYVPAHFKLKDINEITAFIDKHRFAQLISNNASGPFATHIPIHIEKLDGGGFTLSGHIARANPHAKLLEHGRISKVEHLLVFSGPHAYISPRWYTSGNQVPTWNYAAVHVYGTAELVDDEGLLSILKATVDREESLRELPWTMSELPKGHSENLLKAIVGFIIHVTRVEGKLKMSQNKSTDDIRGAAVALETEGGWNESETARIMRSL